VGVALKIALAILAQHWPDWKRPILVFHNGYHRRHLRRDVSFRPPRSPCTKAFRHALMPQYVVDIPADTTSMAALEDFIAGVSHLVAAMIIEPLVQGAGGMRFHSGEMLAALHALAKKYEILFIADEIATGFWRTGTDLLARKRGSARISSAWARR